MIGKLTGTIEYTDSRQAIIGVGGVGYKLFAPISTLESLTVGAESEWWTYLAVRENALDLYGFSTRAELEMFELLITVSGIGPKTALGILNVADIKAIGQAVVSGDSTHLTRVSGIGKKNAEKIVLELKDKMFTDREEGVSNAGLKEDVDVIEALKSLGYSNREAQEALKKIPKAITGTSEKVKQVLKILGS